MNIKRAPRATAAKKKAKELANKSLDKMAEASEAVDKRPLLGKALTVAGLAARSGRSLPHFIYPTISNATPTERQQILDVLDALPLHHTTDVESIQVVPELHSHKPGWFVRGRAKHLHFSNQVRLSREQLQDPRQFRATLLHEIGHTTHYEGRVVGTWGDRSNEELFGRGPYITDYAKTNNKENYAESFEEYYMNPDNLKEKTPEKYEYMDKLDKPGFLQRLVDREEFRETGKYMAEHMADSESSRHLVQGAYFGTALFQTAHGLSQWIRSGETQDSMQHVGGIFNTLTGLSFAFNLNPLIGMGLQGAKTALVGATKRGSLSEAEVESVVSTPFRPIERLAGRDLPELKGEHRPLQVGAIAAGGAVGGITGSVVGPYLGLMAGYRVAGGLGGVVGLVAGGMAGFWAGTQLGGRLAEGLTNFDMSVKPERASAQPEQDESGSP